MERSTVLRCNNYTVCETTTTINIICVVIVTDSSERT